MRRTTIAALGPEAAAFAWRGPRRARASWTPEPGCRLGQACDQSGVASQSFDRCARIVGDREILDHGVLRIEAVGDEALDLRHQP